MSDMNTQGVGHERDGFVEPTPVPAGQEADQHHHRPEAPAEGADFEDDEEGEDDGLGNAI